MNKEQGLTGAQLIADFVAQFLHPNVFLVTGGACAFIVDAVGEHPELEYTCFQHEQASAMAADAVWRSSKNIGVTVSTSGPGATNLITGIACSWFDSIPSFHITGQVNQEESSKTLGVQVRQAGFQETDIVGMVKGITKFAKRVESVEDLAESLVDALFFSLEGRMGPVLIDVPMNIQKAECGDLLVKDTLARARQTLKQVDAEGISSDYSSRLIEFLSNSAKPLVIIGGGLTLAGTAEAVQFWCDRNSIPFVVSWSSLPSVDRTSSMYLGSLGVYGNRVANWAVQTSDRILVFGSRLDNRQRGSNPKAFAPFSKKLVIDIDVEELKKFGEDPSYSVIQANLKGVAKVLSEINVIPDTRNWIDAIKQAKTQISEGWLASVGENELNPYLVIQHLQEKFTDDTIVIADCGANLCWVYQALAPSKQLVFTSYGNSPMGYSLPASIGAKLAVPERPVICFIGDGGLQMNLQELQTIGQNNLNIKIIILNNDGYGIIKQFQDAYFQSRYHASGIGYSAPNFGLISNAYGIGYRKCTQLSELNEIDFSEGSSLIIDVKIPQNALITPKLEMNRFLHDQYPYDGNTLKIPGYPDSPSELN